MSAAAVARPVTFDDVDAALVAHLDDEERSVWWNTPKAQYANRTPLELHRNGETDLLFADLERGRILGRAVHVGAY